MIARVLSRLFVVIFVLLFSQLPVFVDQYVIRLEGHLAESSRQIAAITEAASLGGKTLNAYITKFLEQSDADFKAQGTVMRDAVERNLFLSTACEALHSQNPLLRPVVFVRYVDTHVFADAWKSFAPGLTLTLDVGVWALIGLVIGWVLLMALRGLWQSLVRPSSPPSVEQKK